MSSNQYQLFQRKWDDGQIQWFLDNQHLLSKNAQALADAYNARFPNRDPVSGNQARSIVTRYRNHPRFSTQNAASKPSARAGVATRSTTRAGRTTGFRAIAPAGPVPGTTTASSGHSGGAAASAGAYTTCQAGAASKEVIGGGSGPANRATGGSTGRMLRRAQYNDDDDDDNDADVFGGPAVPGAANPMRHATNPTAGPGQGYYPVHHQQRHLSATGYTPSVPLPPAYAHGNQSLVSGTRSGHPLASGPPSQQVGLTAPASQGSALPARPGSHQPGPQQYAQAVQNLPPGPTPQQFPHLPPTQINGIWYHQGPHEGCNFIGPHRHNAEGEVIFPSSALYEQVLQLNGEEAIKVGIAHGRSQGGGGNAHPGLVHGALQPPAPFPTPFPGPLPARHPPHQPSHHHPAVPTHQLHPGPARAATYAQTPPPPPASSAPSAAYRSRQARNAASSFTDRDPAETQSSAQPRSRVPHHAPAPPRPPRRSQSPALRAPAQPRRSPITSPDTAAGDGRRRPAEVDDDDDDDSDES